MIGSDFEFGDGTGVLARLGKGTYVLEITDLQDGTPLPETKVSYGYTMTPGEMPGPAPGLIWNAKTAVRTSDGVDQETHAYAFGDATTIAFGDCTYSMIPAEIRYSGEGGLDNLRDVLHYLPDLGISYLAETHDDQTDSIFDYISIEALP